MLNFKDLKKALLTSYQTFSELRRCGAVYVDKTSFVQNLAYDRKPLILTRPQRFGKSTLLSTMEELFLHGVKPYDGHDSYFKGLSIEETWQDDGQYHVLHLDFHGLNMQCTQSFELFEQKLNAALQEFADQLGLTVQTEFSDFSSLFEALLKQLADNSLILLVDEYDTPLVSRLQMPEELEAATALLQGLFGKVKKHSSKFRCVFFTGITRYQDLGMGTAGNNFTDISVEPSFAPCCGYTREEIKRCFADYLRYSAAVRYGCSDEEVTEAQIEALLDEMAQRYDGYAFAGEPESRVYSTWSVLKFFGNERAQLHSYWSKEEGMGLPQLLR